MSLYDDPKNLQKIEDSKRARTEAGILATRIVRAVMERRKVDIDNTPDNKLTALTPEHFKELAERVTSTKNVKPSARNRLGPK